MIHKILKKYWGYDSFRPLQAEIINSILSGKDTLGILPTGGGKSITFQVPGLMLPGMVIIVTPLISLMKDQVDNLKQKHIKAVALHSGLTFREKNMVRERLFNDKVKFLYVSPERISSDSFVNEIRTKKISLIVVDEAHCISQWGYDFRPSYLKINRLRKLFPDTPVLALTASATTDVADDIKKQLDFSHDSVEIRGSISRSNLSYLVRQSSGKLFDILNLLKSSSGSAIVYVRSRKKTREIAEFLNNAGISASFYHAGLDNDLKNTRQNSWVSGETRVMVATNAFGMGIDKRDVRMVIHYDLPPSLEEYYQEAGRAGRDGLQSFAVLLISKDDKALLRRRLTMEFPEKDIIKRIYTRICVFSHLEIGEGYEKTVEFDIEKFCNTFSVNEAVLRPALKILNQAGYLEFIEDSDNNSRIIVTVDRDDLYRVKFNSPEQELILTAILRLYPGLFTDYVFINENKIANKTGLPATLIYEKLVELSKAKIIHYIPRRRTPLICFNTAMEEERYITIGKAVYEDRKEILKCRIEAMIDYGYSVSGCRIARLMDYFGEKNNKECGHCDRCREKKKTVYNPLSQHDIIIQLKSLFKDNKGLLEESYLKLLFGQQYEKTKDCLRQLTREGLVKYEEGKWILNT